MPKLRNLTELILFYDSYANHVYFRRNSGGEKICKLRDKNEDSTKSTKHKPPKSFRTTPDLNGWFLAAAHAPLDMFKTKHFFRAEILNMSKCW